MNEGIIFRIQLALFFVDLIRYPQTLADEVIKDLNFTEKVDEMYLHLAPYVPTNILRDLNRNTSIAFIQERADFVCYKTDKNGKDVNILFKEFAPKVIKEISKRKKIARIGIVAHNFFENNCAAPHIAQKYIAAGAITIPDEIYLRYNNIETYQSVNINNITSIESTDKIEIFTLEKKGIVITKDINTIFRGEGITTEYMLSFIEKYHSIISENI